MDCAPALHKQLRLKVFARLVVGAARGTLWRWARSEAISPIGQGPALYLGIGTISDLCAWSAEVPPALWESLNLGVGEIVVCFHVHANAKASFKIFLIKEPQFNDQWFKSVWRSARVPLSLPHNFILNFRFLGYCFWFHFAKRRYLTMCLGWRHMANEDFHLSAQGHKPLRKILFRIEIEFSLSHVANVWAEREQIILN